LNGSKVKATRPGAVTFVAAMAMNAAPNVVTAPIRSSSRANGRAKRPTGVVDGAAHGIDDKSGLPYEPGKVRRR
jgi:hypothetical protein